MLDLYLVVTPVFSILTLLALLTLKKALSVPSIPDIKVYTPLLHTQTAIRITDQKNKSSYYLRTFCFMLKTYTLAQILFGNRSPLKIPLLLTISIISILCYLVPSMYAFCFIGTIITIIYATGCVLANKQESLQKYTKQKAGQKQKQKTLDQIFNEIKNINLDNQNNQQKQSAQPNQVKSSGQSKKLEVFLISLTIILYLIMIGVTFKNYFNSELEVMLIGICVNLLIDSFLVRPLVYAVIAYPLSGLQIIQNFIQKEQIIVQILTKKRVKKVIDSSKLKRIQTPVKLFKEEPQTEDNKENILGLKSDLRKIKLQKSTLPPLNSTPLSLKMNQVQESGGCSLVSLFDSGQKKKIKNGNISFDLSQTFQQQFQQDYQDRQAKQNNIKKQKMRRNSNLIMVNPDQSKIKQFYEAQVQNQQEEDERTNSKSQKDKDNQSFNQSRSHKNSDVLKFTLNQTIEQNNFQNQHEDQAKHNNTLDDQNSENYPSINQSKKNGLLQIREDKGGEDLQQIDLNSPERRNRRMTAKGQDQITNSQARHKKKKYKKFSMDSNRRVIKHSTGDPYLQDQTKMLDYQKKNKKNLQSGTISRKTQINQSKLINSVRRVKNTKDPIVRQNDENIMPSFQIQDL